jgi:hypothetical protein
VTTVQRFDRSEMKKPKRTREGFLRADAYLGRVGVQRYRRADGTEQLELRPPEEVFKKEALESFSHATLTSGHPKTFVTTDNWRAVAVGNVGDSVKQDGDFVAASVLITDPQAIADLERGDKAEVSGGYTCDLDPTPGEWKGQKYDCVQRNIIGNHVAMVARGRAGPEVRIRMDGDDAMDSTLNAAPQEDPPGSGRNTGGTSMVKHRIDGVEYDVSEQAKQALERDSGRHDAQLSTLKKDLEASQSAQKAAESKRDELQKKLDEESKKHADAADPAKVAAAVKQRVALERQVAPVLGDKVKLDEMDEKSIMAAVILKSDKDFKADGRSDDYLRGRFDEALKALKKSTPSPIERARGIAVAAGTHEDEDPLEKALAGYRQRNARAAFTHDKDEERAE